MLPKLLKKSNNKFFKIFLGNFIKNNTSFLPFQLFLLVKFFFLKSHYPTYFVLTAFKCVLESTKRVSVSVFLCQILVPLEPKQSSHML